MLVRLLRNEILALDINIEDAIDILARNLGDVREMLDARVADHDIQWPQFAHRRLEHRFHFRLDCDGPHALAACLFGDVFGSGGVVVVVDCDVCAAGCEFEDDGGADAAAGAGDCFCSVGGIGESVGGGDGGLGAY